MPKTSEMFPSPWLKGSDLQGTPTVKISSITKEVVGQNGEEKFVAYFDKMQKGLILNRTNSDAIEALYGDNTDDWIDEEVTLFSMPVSFQGKVTNACRVRAPKKSAAKQKAELANDLDDEIPFN